MFSVKKFTALAAIASIVAVPCTSEVQAQYYQNRYQQTSASANWAQSLFPNRDHNFGTVAKAAKAEHTFEFKNEFDQPIEILSVNPSCTCTLPEVPTKIVKPGETGQIIAKFQTRKFSGQRGATLNISMKKGNDYSTALVSVKGYIRQDVVVHPPEVDLPKVIASQGADTSVKIYYAGRSDWKITDIKSSNENVNCQNSVFSFEHLNINHWVFDVVGSPTNRNKIE